MLQYSPNTFLLFTFQPGTSFMRIASSSRFSFSIRKALFRGKFSCYIKSYPERVTIRFKKLNVTPIRTSGSRKCVCICLCHLLSCSACSRGIRATLASISSICKRLRYTNTHQQSDREVLHMVGLSPTFTPRAKFEE